MVRFLKRDDTAPAVASPVSPVAVADLKQQISIIRGQVDDLAKRRSTLALPAINGDKQSLAEIESIDIQRQRLRGQLETVEAGLRTMQNEQRHAASPAERSKRGYLHDRERYAQCFRVALVAVYESIARHCALLDQEGRVDELKRYVGGVPGSKTYVGIRGMIRQRASEITREHECRERLERDKGILPEHVAELKLMVEATSWCTDDLVAYVGDVAMPAEVKALLDQWDAGPLVKRDPTGAVHPAHAGYRHMR